MDLKAASDSLRHSRVQNKPRLYVDITFECEGNRWCICVDRDEASRHIFAVLDQWKDKGARVAKMKVR